MRRYDALDRLRGLGVALMVFLHGSLFHFAGLADVDFDNPPVAVAVVGFLLMWAALFAVLSGAVHMARCIERRERGVDAATLLRWTLTNGALMVAVGVVYFVLAGPTLLDLAGGRHDHSVLVAMLRGESVQPPSLQRLLYMNTLHMIGIGTLLAAPAYVLAAGGAAGTGARGALRMQRWLAVAACIALAASWLRIPLYPIFEEALAQQRHVVALALSWLVGKNDPMLPSLGFVLLGASIGAGFGADGRRQWAMPIALGVLLFAGGIAGWVFGPDSMLERSIDWTWYSINLLQAGVLVVGVTAVHLRFDRRGASRPTATPAGGPVADTLRRFGRLGLSVLFAEILVAEVAARLLTEALPGWNGTIAAALGFGAANVLLWAFLLARWERHHYRFSLEGGWIRALRALGRPSTKLAWIETAHHPDAAPSAAGHR